MRTLRVGDLVYAYDEETGESDWKEVIQLFRNETTEWYHIYVNGEDIVCTREHPFYVEGKGFVVAKDLKVGYKCFQSDGKTAKIKKIEVEKLDKPEITYNFEVKDFHTYYVGEQSVLVHNKCVTEMQMTRQEAVKYGKEFLGDGFTQMEPGMYRSADGLRTMRFDLTHHAYHGVKSATHINLYTWRNVVAPGVKNKLLAEIMIFFL